MTRPRALVLMALPAVLVAGCGGGGSSTTSSQSSSATAATTSSTPATTAAAAKPPPAPSGAPANPAAVAEAEALCKSIIDRAPTLSAATKARVESICSKAGHGDLAGARTAAKEVCAEVINASPIPAAAKAQALAECKSAT
jgi:hypothetical protein